MNRIVQRLEIHGRVQGVGYRWALIRQAARLGVHGWVRNRRDGTVEAMAAGTPEALQRLLAWARQGPPGAMVTRVEVHAAEGEFDGFELRPTA
ncbi:MAG: acylphosphatase [Rubrivivax sp.]|nr:acylphosphatase [Rubrivivax sp.]